MSRNSRKLNKTPTTEQKTNPENNSNPFGLSFVVPTEDVILPTAGNFYPINSSLHKVETLEIKHMTAREEDLLSTLEATNDQNIFNRLINNLVTDKNIKAEDMLEEDKMAVLMRARATGYGSKYETKVYCQNCEENTTHEFDLDKTFIEPAEKEMKYNPENDSFTLELPLSKIIVEVKTLSDRDRQLIDKERRKKKDLDIEFNSTISTLKRLILSANDVTDKTALAKLVDILPAADAKEILNFHKNIYPRMSTLQETTCSVCGTRSEREVPLTWAFFRTDL